MNLEELRERGRLSLNLLAPGLEYSAGSQKLPAEVIGWDIARNGKREVWRRRSV